MDQGIFHSVYVCVVVEEEGRAGCDCFVYFDLSWQFTAGREVPVQIPEEDLRVYMRMCLFPLSLETA